MPAITVTNIGLCSTSDIITFNQNWHPLYPSSSHVLPHTMSIYVVVQFLPLVQFFLNQYKIFEPVQNILNWFNFFLFLFLRQTNKKIVWAPSSFILPLLFISTLLTSLTIPSPLSQHPSPYSFIIPQTFGFPLDSCPDALPLSHEDLDASSPIFLLHIHNRNL